MNKFGTVTAVALTAVLAGCSTAGVDTPSPSPAPGSISPSAAASTVARSYPGLFPEYRATFHPDHTDLGGRSNAELARLLPSAAAFPEGGTVAPADTAAEDGSGLGLHGQSDGETRPAQCLYTPFGKNFSRAADGSDWNLYYAASVAYRAPDGSTITATVDRQRAGSDVFALTAQWIKDCGAYQRAQPSFARPEVRTVSVEDAFGPGASIDGVPTYRYVSDVTPLDDDSAGKPLAKSGGSSRTVLARVRSVVVTVQGTGTVSQDALDRVLGDVIAKAKAAN